MQHIYPKQLLTYQLSIGIRSLAGPWMGSSMYATPSGFSHASPQQVISPVSHAGTPGSSQPYTCYVCSATATSRKNYIAHLQVSSVFLIHLQSQCNHHQLQVTPVFLLHLQCQYNHHHLQVNFVSLLCLHCQCDHQEERLCRLACRCVSSVKCCMGSKSMRSASQYSCLSGNTLGVSAGLLLPMCSSTALAQKPLLNSPCSKALAQQPLAVSIDSVCRMYAGKPHACRQTQTTCNATHLRAAGMLQPTRLLTGLLLMSVLCTCWCNAGIDRELLATT